MSYQYDVSIILVNYNGMRYIDNLFDSLEKLELGDLKAEIVFVDNNSTDGSVEYLKQKCTWENLKIIQSKENLGFAGGNNLGVKHSEGKYIVFLNNDTTVDRYWLKELMKTIKSDSNIGMVNSKLLFFYDFIKINTTTKDKFFIENELKLDGQRYTVDNKFCHNLLKEEVLTCFGHSYFYVPILKEEGNSYTIQLKCKNYHVTTDYISIGTKDYFIEADGYINVTLSKDDIDKTKITLIQNAGSGINENYDGYDIAFGEEDSEKYNVEYEINNGCGASIIMEKEDFLRVGGFDESFFMYYEDTDLSYRIKKLGKKIIYCPTSLVRHIHTGSSKEWSDFFIYHVYKNKALFLYKNISRKIALSIIFRNLLNRNPVIRRAGKETTKIILKRRGKKW